MKKGQPLGLDELMIVNPSSENSGMVFLGDDDGTVYEVQGLSEEQFQGPDQFLLADDGTLYKVEAIEPATASDQGKTSTEHLGKDHERDVGRFFLGDDGTLYEVIK